MNEREPIDLEAVRAMISDMDLADPEARARVVAALPPDLVELALRMVGGNLEGAGSEGTSTGTMRSTQITEPFTVQRVDESAVPGVVLLDLPDEEILLVEQEKYAAGKRAIAEATGVEYKDLDLTGMRLMLDENGVPILEPPSN